MSIATTETTRLPLGQLRTDGGTQIRAKVDQRVVEEYAEQMASPETEFPPVIVFDDGHDCWLADGFHRVAAADRAPLADIPRKVRPGSHREARPATTTPATSTTTGIIATRSRNGSAEPSVAAANATGRHTTQVTSAASDGFSCRRPPPAMRALSPADSPADSGSRGNA